MVRWSQWMAAALCSLFPLAESFPMQSLRCYNDYISQSTCTWQECTAARRFLNLTLFK
uniref:Cytokine receptor common subunit beta N-terminal domain-containing protein n=1 Tax=Pelusios castaneus TaxID=367368 RepID=A0A8C8SCQ5_9SAUR